MRFTVTAAVAVAAAVVIGAAGRWLPADDKKAEAPAAAGKAASEVCIPAVPDGKCCLFRVSKAGRGKIDLRLSDPYECKTGTTARGVATLELDLATAGLPCDELPMLIPDGSRLEAKGEVIRRKDDLAHITAKFKIAAPNGGPVLFTGYLEATHRLSTHHKPFGDDPCDPKHQLEGWLVGGGAAEGPTKGYTLRALLIAKTESGAEGEEGYTLGPAALDGVLVECH